MPPDDADPPAAGAETGEASVPPASRPVSLMITRRQKEQLRHLGLSDDEIREMTPAEAHARLGL